MIVNGKMLAQEIKREVQQSITKQNLSLRLLVLVQTESLAIQKFVFIKERIAKELGIAIIIKKVKLTASTEEIVALIREYQHSVNGIVVQLPLSTHVDTEIVLNAIPQTHDVDVLSKDAFALFEKGGADVLPPVVGSIKEILEQNGVMVRDKYVVIVGNGKLVGIPMTIWFTLQGAHVSIVTEDSNDIESLTREADILVLGAGHPNLIIPSMIKTGVVILDAGTSEAQGKLAGDADQACASKAALFTPVPGGIGPVTVAMIFKNLLVLSRKQVG